MKLKAQARSEGNEFITWNDIQACVDRVNVAVHEEHESKDWAWWWKFQQTWKLEQFFLKTVLVNLKSRVEIGVLEYSTVKHSYS